VADDTHTKIDEMDAIDGFFEGIKFHKAAAGLEVSSFGMSIIDLAPGAEDYPEHDHSEDGIGGRMFAARPQQLGPEVKRKVTPGPDGIRLLVIGATPGKPYATGGAL
jgi:hypothetical protein